MRQCSNPFCCQGPYVRPALKLDLAGDLPNDLLDEPAYKKVTGESAH